MKGAAKHFYLWPTLAADDVLVVVAEDGAGRHLKANRTLQLLLLCLNLPLNRLQPLQVLMVALRLWFHIFNVGQIVNFRLDFL